MPVGKSNKVVIDVDVDLKEKIYAALKANGLTVRECFLRQAQKNLLDKKEERGDGR